MFECGSRCKGGTRRPHADLAGSLTAELKVSYLRAMTEATGPVRAEGKALHVGRRIGFAEGRITDEAGRVYATASTTCVVFERA